MALAVMGNVASFEENGFAIIRDVISEADCANFAETLPAMTSAGSRNLLDIAAVRSMVENLKRHVDIGALLPASSRAVQCTYFAKGIGANWSVAPHQDLSIPVASHVPSPECTGWTEKEGVVFTQPPAHVLTSLVAVRLQLDPGSVEAGPLRVAPGSHRLGRLPSSTVAQVVDRKHFQDCVVPLGGVLVMRPLLVHSSGKSRSGVRRVLHILFGPELLPFGLRWSNAG